MSDVDWKSKCREIARWLDELWHADDGYPPHRTRYKFNDVLIRWPDYTRDDAAAWRLHKAITPHANKLRYEDGEGMLQPCSYDYFFGKKLGALPRIDTLERAQVILACALIDRGDDDD